MEHAIVDIGGRYLHVIGEAEPPLERAPRDAAVQVSSVPGAPSREKMLEDEKALVRQYGKETADKMRRNGFSGLSIEERARQAGLSTEYNIVYRNFSRNIHNTDYMEHLADREAVDKQRWQHYQDVRDDTALSTAIACAWRAAWFVELDA